MDEFSTNGTFIKTLISDTAGVNLDAPWGLAIAPAGWGQFGGDLLVGNNNANSAGLTEINAYNLTSGAFEGTLMLNTGQPFSATELWAISFGNGASAGSTNTLFFTAGLANNTDGLFGAISAPVCPRAEHAAGIHRPGRVGLQLEERYSLRRLNGQQRDFRHQAREQDAFG